MNLYTPSARLCAALLTSLIACGEPGTATTAASETGTATTEPATTTTITGAPTSTSTTTSTSATSTPATDTSASATSASDTGSFALMPDLPPPVACDAYHDTCPPGQKCKPYGDSTESGCVDVIDDPVGVGEPCTSAIGSWTDECEAGTICYNFYQSGDSGRCLALCEGSADDATCADSCSTCIRPGGGMFGVCPVLCDPRAPACPEHLSCIISQHGPSFFCIAHNQGSLGAGEVCSSLVDCQEGMACMEAPFLPGCAGTSCCTPVCDLNQADTCESTYPGSVCNPWPTWHPDLNERCLLPGLGLCGAAP